MFACVVPMRASVRGVNPSSPSRARSPLLLSTCAASVRCLVTLISVYFIKGARCKLRRDRTNENIALRSGQEFLRVRASMRALDPDSGLRSGIKLLPGFPFSCFFFLLFFIRSSGPLKAVGDIAALRT